MIPVCDKGRAFLNTTKNSKADVTDHERLEDATFNRLGDTTAATVLTGAHSNTTGTHGRVSIGVQAGVSSVTSSGTWDLQQMDNQNEAETPGTGVSIGVLAGQQVDGIIASGPGNFFEGGELALVSIIIMKSIALHLDLGSNITVTGGTFRTIYGDFHELPEEFERSVDLESCLLAEERFAD
jgi:hypothetical protein